ncbi:MAG: fimbrillin family protein [Candidatus Cryptobacteroides sp.]
MIAHRKALICKGLGILAAAAGMVSCAKVEQNSVPAGLTWQVIEDSQSTKASSGGSSTWTSAGGPSTKASAYSKDDTFLAWAWYLPAGSTWASNKASAQRYIGGETSGATIGYVSSKNAWKNVTWNGSSWDEGVTYYWPKAGTLTFFAASPSSLGTAVSCTTDGIKITDWDVDDNQTVDIMVADLAADQSANTTSTGGWLTGVPTIFRHKLTKVEGFAFNLQKDYSNGHDGSTGNEYESGDIRYFVKSIKINNIPQSGSYANSSPTSDNLGVWTPQGSSTGSYTWYTYSGSEPGLEIKKQAADTPAPANGLVPARDYIYLLPQLFSNPGESPDWSTTPCIEIVYVKWTYTSATNYAEDPITARGSLYDVLGSSAHRLVINRRLNFKITFNNDSNTIIWAPDQEDWGSGEFEIYV